MSEGGATTLIVPGQTDRESAQPASPLLTVASWGVPLAVVCVGAFYAMRGRRSRGTDPRELAFRRIAQGCGMSRGQVRALRRAAAARGLASPVGLALSPSLTARALREHARSR